MLNRRLLVTTMLATSAFAVGCASHVAVGYRVYDPYYSDYHVWEGPEIGYYNNWLVETHRPHVEYRRLRKAEQKDYWTWRHTQAEHH